MEWTLCLFEEITSAERVRDSMLRHSTGYVLGFLSLMQAKVNLKATPRAICQLVMKNILRYSLPAQGWLHNFLATIRAVNDECCLFSFFANSQVGLIDTDAYEERTRVHALNTLRLIILDAPLSSEVMPLVGDAIISAIMGYLDPAWTIRNSSTMVFAAAMLHVIDADKNASNVGKMSKNAISMTELFRSYPALSSFLRSVLECSVNGSLLAGRGEFILPPILPILVLLYRVQPVTESGQDAVSHVNPFIPVIIQCLDHSHMAVRQAAALALTNKLNSWHGGAMIKGPGFTSKHAWFDKHGQLPRLAHNHQVLLSSSSNNNYNKKNKKTSKNNTTQNDHPDNDTTTTIGITTTVMQLLDFFQHGILQEQHTDNDETLLVVRVLQQEIPVDTLTVLKSLQELAMLEGGGLYNVPLVVSIPILKQQQQSNSNSASSNVVELEIGIYCH